MELPYVVKGMDVSFSGILTSVEMIVRDKMVSDEVAERGELKVRSEKGGMSLYTRDFHH